jgi:DNA gyrase inhibitor GyrI
MDGAPAPPPGPSARDLFKPGDRRCTFEDCREDAAVLLSDDGHIALCSAHAGEYAVLLARFKEAPTQDKWREFQKVWVAAMGGGEKAAARMKGYSMRKRSMGHG